MWQMKEIVNMKKELVGEFFATFILIFFGCGSVGLAVVVGFLTELWHVAAFWGVGVTIGIILTHKWCPSHMNPSVTIAMVFSKNLHVKKLLPYWLAQLLGAFLSAGFVYLLMSKSIDSYETAHQITRGSEKSYVVASMFGEFFPNPGYVEKIKVNHLQAFVIELVATFVLLVVIYLLESNTKLNKYLKFTLIGATVSTLIMLVAPYTQACFNPARDYGPRVFAYLAGWGRAAFPSIYVGAFTVYIIAPLTGASLAGIVFRKIA